jgi:hypothetical protein
VEQLAGEGYLQTNRQLECNVKFANVDCSRFVELICSMKNLETLNLFDHELTPDVLAHVFQSCYKLTNLHIATYKYKTHEMAEHLKNQLRSGFQRLRRLHLVCFIDKVKWPAIQEILT